MTIRTFQDGDVLTAEDMNNIAAAIEDIEDTVGTVNSVLEELLTTGVSQEV